ncbi:protein brambleberry-like [Spheniscus humboldti]
MAGPQHPPPEELGTSLELEIPPHVPFEMTTGDKLFQAEATCWEQSRPDSCHHQVVVRLYSSCTDLSEEEEAAAAELGVAVFNCQASTEGHQPYPRTPDMEGQEELWKWPNRWLRPRLETPVHHSLQQSALDETLIASRQHRVAQLTEDITQRMGNVSSRGAAGLQEGHRVVLSDLHHAQERARDVYSQLESNLALLLAQQRQMEEVMEKLQRVNRSLGLMLVAVEGARSRLENSLQHLHAVLDPAGQEGHQGWRMPCLNPFFPDQVMPELALGTRKHWEPKSYSPSQPLASVVPLLSLRSPCQGLTRAGQRCRKKAIPGQDFCHVHTTS